MTSNALQKRKRVADPVAGCSGELARVQQWVDRDDFLQQTGHDAKAVPEYQSQLRDLLALLTKFHQSSLSSGWLHQVGNPLEDSAVFLRHLLIDTSTALVIHSGKRRVVGLIIVVLPGIVVLVDGNARVVLLSSLSLLLGVIQTLVAIVLIPMLRPSIRRLGELGLIGMLGLQHRVRMDERVVKTRSFSSHLEFVKGSIWGRGAVGW